MSFRDPAATRPWVWPLALALVTLLAFGLRWYYVATAMVIHPIRGDAGQYYVYAWNLIHHGVFSGAMPGSATVIPDSYRDPGFPLLLALWMKAFPNQAGWYAATLMTQAVLGALTVTLAMQLGRRWLSWPWAVGAGLLMAVWPHNITIASDLLTETLFGFLVALAMLLCIRAGDRHSPAWATGAGLCFGAAALTNAVLLPFGVLLALYLAWRRWVPRRVWLALLIGALILPGAWAVRNSQLPAPASHHSSTDRALQNLVQGSWPPYHDAYIASLKHDYLGTVIMHRIQYEVRLIQASPRQGLMHMLHRMGRHPLYYLAWYTLKKPSLLWGWRIRMGQNDIYVYATKFSPFDNQPVMRSLAALCHTINPLLAALALVCLLLVLVRHRWPNQHDGSPYHYALPCTLLLLVYVTVVYSVLQSEPRYSIPFRPFEMLLAMTVCAALAQWIHRQRRKAIDHPSESPPLED